MTDVTIYTLVLIPPDSLGERLVKFSHEVTSLVKSDVRLGADALPHITLVQWKNANLEALKRQTSPLRQGKPGVLTLAGISIVPGPEGDNWIELPILSSAGLRQLQDDALAATRNNGEIANGVGDRFRPHVTIGLTYTSEIRLPALSASLLRASDDSWSVRLGVSGPNYTLAEILEWDE